MKKNIKFILTASLALLFMVLTNYAQAQVRRPIKAQRAQGIRPSANMMHARRLLRRTTFVIVKANQAVKKNNIYTGDLARAVAHQRFAKKLYFMRKPHRAILHSRLARRYAFKALEANKEGNSVEQSYQFTKEENALAGPEDKSLNLEKELEQTTFDDKTVTDKEMNEIEVLETDPADYKNE